jgi:hypothetical protein
MSLIESELDTAKAQADEARKRLTATMVALQTRLHPKALAREAFNELKETGEDLARSGAAVAKRNAGPIAGIAATLGLVLARHQLGGLLSHFTGGDETADDATSLKDHKSPKSEGKKS